MSYWTLASAVTATGQSSAVSANPCRKAFHAVLTGTGAISCTVKVQASNTGANWLDLATITLSGTTSATDGFASEAPWVYYRTDTTAISGTGASLTITVGE